MSNGSNERRSYDPLDRATFEAIAYSAVGRASEIGTYPSLSLTHSGGNSDWSVGIVQWDFGQPGRGKKVGALLAGYQAWAAPGAQFTGQEVPPYATAAIIDLRHGAISGARTRTGGAGTAVGLS